MTAFAAWLYANVVGNLVASMIAGTAVWLWGRRKLAHLHARLDHQDNRLADIHASIGGQP